MKNIFNFESWSSHRIMIFSLIVVSLDSNELQFKYSKSIKSIYKSSYFMLEGSSWPAKYWKRETKVKQRLLIRAISPQIENWRSLWLLESSNLQSRISKCPHARFCDRFLFFLRNLDAQKSIFTRTSLRLSVNKEVQFFTNFREKLTVGPCGKAKNFFQFLFFFFLDHKNMMSRVTQKAYKNFMKNIFFDLKFCSIYLGRGRGRSRKICFHFDRFWICLILNSILNRSFEVQYE